MIFENGLDPDQVPAAKQALPGSKLLDTLIVVPELFFLKRYLLAKSADGSYKI